MAYAPTAIGGLTRPNVDSLDMRRLRLVAIAISAGLLIGIALSTIVTWPQIVAQAGEDYRFFLRAADQWRASGEFYLPRQLSGPYQADSGVDVLYPPWALFLFVPFLYLPAVLWWAIPLGILGWHVATARPAWWSWPLLTLLCWLPRDQSIVIWGNTGMWVAAFVALALRAGWPSLLILVKPSFAPFALVGMRRRSWWVGLGVLVALLAVQWPLWADFLTITRNNVGPWPGLLYSVPDYPFAAFPIVAWLARSDRSK